MNKEVYLHLLKTYGQNPAMWAGLLLGILRTIIIRVYIVVLMAQVTASIASGDMDGAKQYTFYFFLAYVIGSLIGTLGDLICNDAENNGYKQLRLVYYKKLIGKDLAFYRDNQTGYLVGTFRQYLDSTILLIRFLRGEALGTTISLLIPPIILFMASVKVGFVAVAVVLVQFIYISWASRKVNKYREMTHEAYRKVTAEVSDEITNIVAFKSGGMEARARDKIETLMDEETDSFNIRRKITTLLDLPRNIVTALGTTLAVYIIIAQPSATNPESLGLIVLTLTYMFQIVRNVGALPELITTHDDFVTKIHPNLRYLGSEYEGIRDPENPRPLRILEGAITIQDVNFDYVSSIHDNKRIPVFNNLNITISGGEHVGIVGLSGAGKSTLANLLLRFDDIDSGSIRIDGTDTRTVRQSDLRRNIAYVPQEPLLFHQSIRDNIAYYVLDATEDDIIRAAKASHAHEFIERLPDGYNTLVGERGIKLSGGQKQRIAIARAVLKKAPIMIFDEATSALDTESEQIIQRALPEIIEKQTAIVIAHRLSTVAGLDRILVMHEGRVIEEGSHKELLKLGGRYYALWQKQTAEFGTAAHP